MDPNANLKRQAELLPDFHTTSIARYEIYELRIALRLWLDRGGFAPNWDEHPKAATAYRQWSGTGL